PEDIALDAGVEGHDPEPGIGRGPIAPAQIPVALAPAMRRRDAHLADKIAPGEPGQGPRSIREAPRVGLGGRDDAFLRAAVAQMPRERAGVDALYAHDAVLAHVGVERHPAPPVRGVGAGLLHDEATESPPPRL